MSSLNLQITEFGFENINPKNILKVYQYWHHNVISAKFFWLADSSKRVFQRPGFEFR